MATGKGFRFVPDDAGIFEATSSDEVGKILTQRARDAVVEIRKLGPRRRSSFLGWRRGLRALPARRVGRQLEATVEVASSGWHIPEYGTSTVEPTAPIRRGVRLADIEFREGAG